MELIFFSGTVNDVSRAVMSLADIPKELHDWGKELAIIVFAKGKDYKMLVVPKWSIFVPVYCLTLAQFCYERTLRALGRRLSRISCNMVSIANILFRTVNSYPYIKCLQNTFCLKTHSCHLWIDYP